MKFQTHLLFIPLLVLTTGCATNLSSTHGYGHQNYVSVDTHGNGAAVVGALIVGGIIGSILNDNEREKQDAAIKMAEQRAKATAELKNSAYKEQRLSQKVNDTQQDVIAYRETISLKQSEMQWYQLGKDGNCYLMSVNSGVTNIVSAVPTNKCKNPE